MTNGLHIGDVLDILSEIAPDVSLSEALRASRNICQLSDINLERAAQESYDNGYELGKRDAEVPSNLEMTKLRRVYDFQVQRASELIPGIVFRVGRDRKIQCIKELRNSTGLGLKETKDIVDAFIVKLDAATEGLADWERDLLYGANEGTNYSDEPPF